MIFPAEAPPLLEVRNLNLQHRSQAGATAVLHDVSFKLGRSEILGVIGESGAGKSTLGNTLIGLLGPGFEKTSGDIRFHGRPRGADGLGDRTEHEGWRVSAIFQDHTASLDPLMRIGVQLEETILASNPFLSRRHVRSRALELLDRVGIPDPTRRFDDYPHQFSGGQRQRIVIAIALCGSPDVIIADEPTSALDATVQKQVLALLRSLVEESDVAIVLITHDMGVIAEIADRVLVMRNGRVIEEGNTSTLLDAPRQDYTRTLLAAVPRLRSSVTSSPLSGGSAEASPAPAPEDVALATQAIFKTFETRKLLWSFGEKNAKAALNDVSVRIVRGGITGIIGESGSGKTTLGRIVAGLETASAGKVVLDGHAFEASRSAWRTGLLGRVQMIFQDPAVSLNPRMTIGATLSESARFGASRLGREDSRAAVMAMIDRLGLPRTLLSRHPHQLSGGQKQRVCIGRALLAKPGIIVADEPTSALDVTVQAEIVALLRQTVSEEQISMMFISHDLALVQSLCSQIYILKDGRVEDAGSSDEIFARSANPYTRSLIEARPSRFVA